jgi:hypothetical protein
MIVVAILSAALTACSHSWSQSTTHISSSRLEFSRMLVHWRQYIDPGYLKFVEEVQPEVVQVGFYGVDFWALAHVPKKISKVRPRQPMR